VYAINPKITANCRSTDVDPGPGMPEDAPDAVGSDCGIRRRTAIEGRQ
jgi:hypothetical protein